MQINLSLMFSGVCGDAFSRTRIRVGRRNRVHGHVRRVADRAGSAARLGDKVWFARLRAGGLDVTGGDVLPSDYETPRGFSMVLAVANAGEADRQFAGLGEGGEVLMPLQATHWSPRYGVVRDAFGIRWEINCDGEPPA